MSKTVYFSTIDKDVRRVLGKRLYNKCKEDSCFISERSNGDVEYKLDSKSYRKLRKYMLEHRKSRLCKAWTGCRDGFNVRFMIDSWQ